MTKSGPHTHAAGFYWLSLDPVIIFNQVGTTSISIKRHSICLEMEQDESCVDETWRIPGRASPAYYCI